MVAAYKDGTSPRHRRILRAIGMGQQPRTSYLKCKDGSLKPQPHMFEIDYPRVQEGMLRSTWDILDVLSARGFCAQEGGNRAWKLTDKGINLVYQKAGRINGGGSVDGWVKKGISASVQESKLIELMNIRKAQGWADPVDAMLDIAYETASCEDCSGSGKVAFEVCKSCKGQGEVWGHEVNIRLAALQGAAPYVNPKLQAIAVKTSGSEKSHAEWLKELEDGRPTIEGSVTVLEEEVEPVPQDSS